MNKTMGGSYHNLVALADAKYSDARQVSATAARSPLSLATHSSSALSLDSQGGRSRLIIVSNVLPVHQRRVGVGWEFEGNEDALIAQAMDGIPEEYDVIFVGCTPSDVDIMEQEEVTQQLKAFGCAPVFLPPDVRERYYKGFCKQQLWPLFHYVLPMSPSSAGRYCAELWQAYVKANKAFTERVVEECATDADTVWIHDYHLLAMPSLLRKRFNKIRCGLFLHSPFPSSEMFRAFPKRDELLRSMLNADLIGFHTFDYARHFLSCCSRMLGLEHQTTRGSISVEYYGRNVGVKIMPTGVNPARLLSGFDWPEFRWRRGELRSQFEGRKLLLGLDDMDVFKGIELKLQAFERVLEDHPEFVGQVVLAQITDAPRSSGKELSDLNEYVDALVERINARFGRPGYQPVFYLRRPMPLHERIAFLSLADAAVVTATRDGMNLVPYEYVVCRQGPGGKGLEEPEAPRESMLVVSEFVGCSPSLSGAIRVNPWSIEGVADGMYAALRASKQERRLRHEKHWRYVSQHTVAFWAQSFMADLARFTRGHPAMKCYGLGLGLDTFRLVALDANFRRLDDGAALAAYKGSRRRLLLLDYDGTLIGGSSISSAPTGEVLSVLGALTSDPANEVWLISGRAKRELGAWFEELPNLGLAAEHGFFTRHPAAAEWVCQQPHADTSGWQAMALPILKQYQESTDGSWIEAKESGLVWHYRDADPDFGNWQAKELTDHLEDVLSNLPVEVTVGSAIVEIKPQGVTKGCVVEAILERAAAEAEAAAAAEEGAEGEGEGEVAGREGQEAGAAGAAGREGAGGAAGASNGAAAAAEAAAARAAERRRRVRFAEAPEFVLCVGDDRSDEDMFAALEQHGDARRDECKVFACVVGQKPSRAPLYLNDHYEVLALLAKFGDVQLPPRAESFTA